MKIFRNIYLKTKFKIWLNVKKGYRKFVKIEGLEKFRSIKNDLFLVKIEEKTSNNFLDIEDGNKLFIQYVNQKLFEAHFFNFFLYFYNLDKKLIFPIPKEFNSVFVKHKLKVNFFLSNCLWYFFVFLNFFIGIKDLVILIFNSLNLKKKLPIENDYCIYGNISYEKFNLPNSESENKKLFNIVRWCNENFSNIYSIFIGTKTKIKNDYFSSYKNIENILSYKLDKIKVFKWTFKIFLFSIYYIFTFRFWNLLIMPEIIKTGYIKFTNQKLPNYIIFLWTNNYLRPLWTYALEKKIKIYMIFIGTLNGIITKEKSELTKNDFEGLSVATWPNYYTWSKEHKKYIEDRINYQSEVINLNKQIYFKDTSSKLILPNNSISVFGYENNKFILGYSTLADYDQENKNLLKKFYLEINEVLKKNNYYLVLKRKKKLGKFEFKRFRKFFEDLKKDKNVIFIDEDHSVEKIINLSKASISMPFTSPACIGKILKKPSIFYDPCKWINLKDPSRMELEIINNKTDLDDWVNKL